MSDWSTDPRLVALKGVAKQLMQDGRELCLIAHELDMRATYALQDGRTYEQTAETFANRLAPYVFDHLPERRGKLVEIAAIDVLSLRPLTDEEKADRRARWERRYSGIES